MRKWLAYILRSIANWLDPLTPWMQVQQANDMLASAYSEILGGIGIAYEKTGKP